MALTRADLAARMVDRHSVVPLNHLPFDLGGIVRGDGACQPTSALSSVLVDHTNEALETDIFCGHWKITHCCSPGPKEHNT